MCRFCLHREEREPFQVMNWRKSREINHDPQISDARATALPSWSKFSFLMSVCEHEDFHLWCVKPRHRTSNGDVQELKIPPDMKICWFQTFRDFHLHQDKFAHLKGITQRDGKISSCQWRWWWWSTSGSQELHLWYWRSIEWPDLQPLDSSLTNNYLPKHHFFFLEKIPPCSMFIVSFPSTLKLTSGLIFFFTKCTALLLLVN